MSILEGLALNWVQYQFSHGMKWATIQIILFGWLLHSLLESENTIKFNSVQKEKLEFAHLSSLSRPHLSTMEQLHRRSSCCNHG
jgi:hypothetical protein